MVAVLLRIAELLGDLLGANRVGQVYSRTEFSQAYGIGKFDILLPLSAAGN